MGGAEVSTSRCRGGEWAETGGTEGERLRTERYHNLYHRLVAGKSLKWNISVPSQE